MPGKRRGWHFGLPTSTFSGDGAGHGGHICAYNRVNGGPNCADFDLLTTKVRVNGALTVPEDAVADVLKAGMYKQIKNLLRIKLKLECRNGCQLWQLLKKAHQISTGTEKNSLKIGSNQVCSQDHQALACEAARSGIVLLQNSANLLPSPKAQTNSLAVIGPNADAPQTLLENYTGPSFKLVSPLQALQNYVNNTHCLQGCDSVACTTASIREAMDSAKSVDYVVLIMGLDQTQEGKEQDRDHLGLPGMQESLVSSVVDTAKQACDIGPVDVSFAKDNNKIGGIIWAGYLARLEESRLQRPSLTITIQFVYRGKTTNDLISKDFTRMPMIDMRMRPNAATDLASPATHGGRSPSMASPMPGPASTSTALSDPATSFPQVILSAASFDPHLWFRIAQAIGIEARALYNAGQTSGMTFWSPNINIFRDPRWGRGQETPGEDPSMSGTGMASSATPSTPKWVTAKDLADTYEPPFQKYVVSDCDAVSLIYDAQRYAVAYVLKSGMDVNCGGYLLKHTKSALDQKKISVGDINRALSNLFSTRIKLGLFNGNPKQLPFGDIGSNQVCSPDHQALALEAAQRGIVLLQNTAKILPLPKTQTNSLAVIGPNANVDRTLLGIYAGPSCNIVSPLQALKKYVKDTHYLKGCDSVACTSTSMREAVYLAKSVDYVVLIMGLDDTQEKEGQDRVNLGLPGMQESLVSRVADAAKKPVILVIVSGGPVDISFAKNNNKIGGIIWAGYPGEAGGTALAEIIFGDHNPGLHKGANDRHENAPQCSNGYPGRTYRFYTGKPVFKFGHGLTYTKYAYTFKSVELKQLDLRPYGSIQAVETGTSASYLSVSELENENCDKLKFSATVGVRNTREMSGNHPVLLFAKPSVHRDGSPIKQLVGFQSMHLNAGEEGEVEFGLSPCEHLSRANEEGLMVMERGSYFLMVGEEMQQISIVL
ncbi:hypothetical protein Sjap_018722 [Stephania japonica]|uniref:Fibronectin type III-like domain-containing protein n=1 Tax=Stephania japonica TaxID=461633 RepID=A0AAP0NJR0_9MAGN